MEKYSYNYPDSNDSSPRSREIDFDNPPPWDDQNPHQNQQPQSYKVKFMCSYGASKLSAVCGGGDGGGDVSFKYQLPGEDLDALISVTNDDDLEHMMHEYDRLLRLSSKPARLRLFLFPASSGGFGSQGSTQSDRDRFVEALNTVPRLSESEKSVTATPNNADFLFGSEKIAAPPPPPPPEVKLPVPVANEPPLFNDPRVIQPDPIEIQRQMLQEFQRLQIRDQEAVYRRKSEDGGVETGNYFPPPYAQSPAPPPPSQPTNQQAPPMTFWQGNHNNNTGGVFPTMGLGVPEQPVYMIPSPSPSQHPGAVYHAPPQPQPQGVVRPIQGNQGGYYPPAPVQRMAPDTYREQAYTMAQPQPPIGTKVKQQQQPPFTTGPPPPPQYSNVPPPQHSAVPPPQHSAVPPPQYSAIPPPQHSAVPPPQYSAVGLPETTTYIPQVTYAGGMGKQVYYTEAPPQNHGIGLPVTGMNELRTGPDGKIVAMNMTSKVSSQNSDSAV